MAARYRKIDPRIWTDEKFSRLSHFDRLVSLYIITAQANRIGLFSFSPGKAVEDLKTSPRAFLNAFTTACQTFGWKWDAAARVLFIPSWFKYNHPENPKHFVGCLKDLADLPATPLFETFKTNTRYLEADLHETLGHSSTDSYHTAIGIAMGIGKPYQEQEQEQESPLPPKGASKGSNGLQPEEIRQKWNAISGVKSCKALGPTIHKQIQTRLTEHPDPAWWDTLFQQVHASPFLCGRTNGARGTFQASLDWVLKPTNRDKILAGNYESARSSSKERLPL